MAIVKKNDKVPPATSGFTLIELLFTVTIIGLLSTIATVSYDSARASSRDTKRVSDVKQIQQSLELYFEYHDYYPADKRPGSEGDVVGLPETVTLSNAGFSPSIEGTTYMLTVPANPTPGGSPYVYRSLYRDGRDCTEEPCDAYAILFTLEKPSGSLLAGPHALTPTGTAGAEGGYAGAGLETAGGGFIGIEGAQALLTHYAAEAAAEVTEFVGDPTVKTVTEAAVAPTVAATAVANTALATQSMAGVEYLLFFITQPLLLLKRRGRKSWGTVYNSLSRLPEDLVIVRLADSLSGRVIRSEVTDKDGRFSFLVPAGQYRLQVSKGGFEFPSKITAGLKTDGQFLDIYHGEIITVSAEGALLTPNIPIDPSGKAVSDDEIIRREQWRKIQGNIAIVGPVLGGASLIIKPSLFVACLFLLQILSYMFFRRFAVKHAPKNWGVVYEEGSERPVPGTVLRIFALPYHKMLDSRVTDRDGRYNFRVGGSKYYLTATRPGYLKTESDPIDFSSVAEPSIIAADIPLRRSGQAAPTITVTSKTPSKAAAAPKPPVKPLVVPPPPQPPPEPTPPPPPPPPPPPAPPPPPPSSPPAPLPHVPVRGIPYQPGQDRL